MPYRLLNVGFPTVGNVNDIVNGSAIGYWDMKSWSIGYWADLMQKVADFNQNKHKNRVKTKVF